MARWLYLRRVPLLPRLIYIVNRIAFSVVLPPSTEVGRDVVFGYAGLGIVVHRRARIGDKVVIGPNVTIGGRSGFIPVPVIEDDVMIGAGARILGPVRIGRGAQIGANAVVLTDIPAGATAVGVPARVVAARPIHRIYSEIDQ
ncbi:MAG TPA: DapH/DapD/GlmU-related protein [Noviherbaspirillum sp.]